MELPLLRVSRLVTACSRCRNAKTRCDGKLPACTACERSNRAAECSSANDQFAKGKERSYVASLESRVERLEKQVAEARQRKSSTTMEIGGPNLPPSNGPISGGRRRVQRKEASDVDELVSDFGYLSVNATARDFHGFTKVMSFARLVLSTSSVEKMPRYSGNTLPPREQARALMQQCLDEVLILYPIFRDTAVYGSFEAVYQRASTPLHWWNTCMILAIALVSRSRVKDDAFYRDAVRHASSALEHAESVLQPGSVAGLQAILLLVVYSMLDPSHYNSWYLIGVASRVMVDIGIHQEPAEDLQVNKSQLILKRRLFYCVYTLDRAISIAHVRAFSFSDDSANVDAPVDLPPTRSLFDPSISINGQAMTDPNNPALLLLKLRRIQSSWYQAVFQSNHECLLEPWQNRCGALSEMCCWIAGLPPSTPAAVKNLLVSELSFSSILLLHPHGTDDSLCSYGKALVFDYATKFAEATFDMCSHYHTYNYSTSHDILRTLFVGQAFIYMLQNSPTVAFNVTAPNPPPVPAGSAAPPRLQRREFRTHVDDAIDTITRLDKIVYDLGRRFGFPPSCNKYKYDSTATLQSLSLRRQQQDPQILTQLQGAYIDSTLPSIVPFQDTHATTRGYLPS